MKRTSIQHVYCSPQETTLLYMPVEVMLIVLGFLNLRSLLRFASTCKKNAYVYFKQYESKARESNEFKALECVAALFERLKIKEGMSEFLAKYNAIMTGPMVYSAVTAEPMTYSAMQEVSDDNIIEILVPILDNPLIQVRAIQNDISNVMQHLDIISRSEIGDKKLSAVVSTAKYFKNIYASYSTGIENEASGHNISLRMRIIFTDMEDATQYLENNAIFTFNRIYTNLRYFRIKDSYFRACNRIAKIHSNHSHSKLDEAITYYELLDYTLIG